MQNEGYSIDQVRMRLATNIRNRRLQLKLSQARLGQETGVGSSQTISQIEKGERDLKAYELFNFAKALYCTPSELLNEVAQDLIVAWRNKPDSDVEIQEAKFGDLIRTYNLVEQWADEISAASLPSLHSGNKSLSFDWVEQEADSMRKYMELGNYPALSLEKVLEERFAVKIFYLPDFKGSAASVRGEQEYAIVLNTSEVHSRRNFSLAHELFHLLTWDSLAPNAEDTINIWGEKIEQLADKFASCLLLPAEHIRERTRQLVQRKNTVSLRAIAEIAEEYDVSRQAMLWRLHYLGLLTRSKTEELLEECAKVSVRRENIAENTEKSAFPMRFMRLLKLAYLQGEVGAGRVAEILGKPLYEMREEITQWEAEDCGG